MAPRKTPRKTPAKKEEPKPASLDLSNPNVEAGAAVALVAAIGIALGGAVPTSVGGALSTFTLGGLDKTVHSTWWPFSLLTTLHVLNSCKSNGKWWVNDILNCCFNAFAGLLVTDAMKGRLGLDVLFANGEANFSLVLVCWYLVNHNVPFTKLNVYQKTTGFLSQFLPLEMLLDLSSLVFNANLLISVAKTGSVASAWPLVPMACGKLMLSCVFVHCAAQFYNQRGLSYNVGTACSQQAYEAAVVALWYGTNGLAGLPVVGSYLAIVTSPVEGFFGGRDACVLSVMVILALFGHLVPLSLDAVWSKVYQVTGIRSR